jgi:signal transduction histidine kinase
VERRRGSGKRRSRLGGVRARLAEAEATLEAIRRGEVDALVVSSPDGERTLAIEGATHPYQALLHAMSDGAAVLHRDGTILFGNRRLEEMARTPSGDLRRSRFQQLVLPAERARFEGVLRKGAGGNAAGEFAMLTGDAPATPVWIALSPVPLETHPGAIGEEPGNGATVVMAIISDLTERKRAEATRLALLKRLISAEDEERRRIARELHDETGQALTALLVGLRLIEEQAITIDVRSAAQQLRGVAAQTVDNVGRLARGLHPSILDDVGLAAAVRQYVSNYATSFGVAIDTQVEVVSHALPPVAATTMYRILQEALTNVARHARAQTVGVELLQQGTMLTLEVRDDGVGFDAGAAPREERGLGLHGMRERVALLGGSVEIESRPGHGTVVRARIPVPPAPPQTPRRPRRKRTR